MLKILALPLMMLLHPAHVTMTSISYIPGSDSLKMLVSFDYELFLRDYRQTVNDDLDLDVLRSYQPFPTDMANNYINLKVSIRVNKKPVVGKLLKAEVNGGLISLNVLYRLGNKPKSITVRNTILNGLFSDVENLTIINIRNIETGIKFTQDHNEETFLLK